MPGGASPDQSDCRKNISPDIFSQTLPAGGSCQVANINTDFSPVLTIITFNRTFFAQYIDMSLVEKVVLGSAKLSLSFVGPSFFNRGQYLSILHYGSPPTLVPI